MNFNRLQQRLHAIKSTFGCKGCKAFMLALALLTRLPTLAINDIQPQDSSRSALFYPLVGLVIGLLLYLPVLLFIHASPMVLAAIIVTLWSVITGGLHLDGLADSSDAWLGGMGDEDKIHRILKDPLVGTAGVVSIVCVLLLKFVTLTALLEKAGASAGWFIIFAPIVGRSMILLLFMTTQYIREQGLASEIVEHLPVRATWQILTVLGVLSVMLSFSGLVFALIGFWLLRRMMLNYLAGFTGDTVGATVEITEMLWLLGIVLLGV